MDRDFKGVWIPKEIWLNDNLTIAEKALFAEIDSLDGQDGCFASNEYLANFCGLSESFITKAISKLKRLGFINVDSFDGRKRVLRVVKFTTLNSKIYDAECHKNESLHYIYKNRENNIESTGTGGTHSKLSRYKNKEVLTDDLDSTLENIEKKSMKRRGGQRYNEEEIEQVIEEYSDNEEVQEALRNYKDTIRDPQMGERRLKNASQFKGYLKKLDAAIKNPLDSKEVVDVILYSTLHSYLDFYPVADRKKSNKQNFLQKIDRGLNTSDRLTKEEFEELKRKGRCIK